MVTRVESAAATRAALVQAASELLGEGGPDAVTLRAVGARAGVSRGAPYGHFRDKEHLLSQLAIDAWEQLGSELESVQADTRLDAGQRLHRALGALLDTSRERPHLYALMWNGPTGDLDESTRAVTRSQNAFLAIVADIVGADDARRYGALLMSSTHGIAGMEASGHLSMEKWSVSGDDLVATLVRSIERSTTD